MALKIGILTLPITENYGGILQAVTLYRLADGREYSVVFERFFTKEMTDKPMLFEVFTNKEMKIAHNA